MYVKFLPKDMIVGGLKYKIGKNIYPNTFDPCKCYSLGGIYFNSFRHMQENRSFIRFDPIIAFLYLDNDTSVVKVDDMFKSPEIYIFKLMSFNNFFQNMSEYNQIKFVKNNPYSIEVIDHPSETIQLAAVNVHGEAIKYIKHPSIDVQKEAVSCATL